MIGAHYHDLGSGEQSRVARLRIQSDRNKQPRPRRTLQNAGLLILEISRHKPRTKRAKLAVDDKERSACSQYCGGYAAAAHYSLHAHAGVGVASS